MQRLYDRGHRHISFLGVPHSDVTTGERRHLAYLAFCEKHRLTPTAALPGLGMKQGYDTVASVLMAETSARSARRIPSPSAPASTSSSRVAMRCSSPASAARR